MTKIQLKAESVTFPPVVPLLQPMAALKQSGAFVMYSLYARIMISPAVTYPSDIPGLRCEKPVSGRCGILGANKRLMFWKVNESWRSSWMGAYGVAHDLFYRKLTHQEVRQEVAVTNSSLFC
jgi:hypothetical protein